MMNPDVRDRTLGGLRWKIDILDSMLAELLARRLALSLEVQAFKEEEGLPAEDPTREANISRRLLMRGGPPEVAAMLQAVIDLCKGAFRARRASATSRSESAGASTPG